MSGVDERERTDVEIHLGKDGLVELVPSRFLLNLSFETKLESPLRLWVKVGLIRSDVLLIFQGQT